MKKAMKKQEIIEATINMVKHNAYSSQVCEAICGYGFDVNMMRYHRDIASGKAFGGLEILHMLTGKTHDDIYDLAVEEAYQDICKADYDIVKLLRLAGFDGQEYYDTIIKFSA